jgi:AraC family transcriptional regulator
MGRMLKLAIGESYGNILKRREISGIVFTQRLFSSGFVTPRHAHEAYGLYVILHGHFREHQRGQSWFGGPSMVVTTPPGEEHMDAWVEPGSTLSLELTSSWLQRLQGSYGALGRPCRFSTGTMVRLATELRSEFGRHDITSDLALEALALELVAEGLRETRSESHRLGPRWLTQAKEFLRQNLAQHVSHSDIALAVGIHPAHLSRTFRRYVGCTVGGYLRSLRMEQARMDLVHTDLSLSAIALAAGYSDQSHFSSAFRRLTGVTPGQFRRATGCSTRAKKQMGGNNDASYSDRVDPSR